MKQQLLDLLAAAGSNAGGGVPFIGMLGGTGLQKGTGVAIDGGGNLFFSAEVQGSAFGAGLSKYSKAGVIQWQKLLGSSSANFWNDVSVDGTGSAYVCGSSNPSGVTDFQMARYDTNGNVLWQRYYNYYEYGTIGTGVFSDAAAPYTGYFCGYFFDSEKYNGLIARWDPSGSPVIQTSLYSNGGGNVFLEDITVDASGNVYVCGRDTGSSKPLLAKLNSSFVPQWIIGNYNSVYINALTTDSSGNIYACGGGSGTISISKYNSSGTCLWYKRYTSTYGGANGYGIALDSAGNVYACGYSEISGTNGDVQVIKVDNSGNAVWQRRLTIPGVQQDTAYSIAVKGNMFTICGDTLNVGSGDILFANLPTDGSKTGTYTVNGVNITYAAASMTVSTLGTSMDFLSVSYGDFGVPASASSLTAANSTLTSSVTLL